MKPFRGWPSTWHPVRRPGRLDFPFPVRTLEPVAIKQTIGRWDQSGEGASPLGCWPWRSPHLVLVPPPGDSRGGGTPQVGIVSHWRRATGQARLQRVGPAAGASGCHRSDEHRKVRRPSAAAITCPVSASCAPCSTRSSCQPSWVDRRPSRRRHRPARHGSAWLSGRMDSRRSVVR